MPNDAQREESVPPWLEPGSPDWHYRQADKILERLDELGFENLLMSPLSRALLAKAQVHALLAQSSAPTVAEPTGRDVPAGSIEAQIIAEQRESVNEKEADDR